MEKKDNTEKNHIEKEHIKKDNPYHITYDNYLDTNACTECTGLMQNVADGRSEWNAYREIFDFLPKPPRDEEDSK